jgi:hypothetical protein
MFHHLCHIDHDGVSGASRKMERKLWMMSDAVELAPASLTQRVFVGVAKNGMAKK